MSLLADFIARHLPSSKAHADGWQARCPAHEDARPSLAVSSGADGRILLHCHAGCETSAVLAALGLSEADLFPPKASAPDLPRRQVAEYIYRHPDGAPAFRVVRYEPKSFRQHAADGQGGWRPTRDGAADVVFQLDLIQGHSRIAVVEGEQDVLTLRKWGIPATCNAGGAGKWRAHHSQQLQTAGVTRVVLVPDNDAPGERHMHEVAASLRAIGIGVQWCALPDLPPKGDVTDAVARGLSREALKAALQGAPEYVPPADLALVTVADDTTATPAPRTLPLLTIRDLSARVAASGPQRFLLRGIFPAGDYGVHSAEAKSQKTWTAGDAAISVASGTPFLGHFAVDTPGHVLLFIGEGGEAAILRRLRAIAAAREIRVEDLPITVCARAPHFGDNAHMRQVADALAEVPTALVVIDPYYLAARGINAQSVTEAGALLERVQHVCQDARTSLLVVHHHNRSREAKGAMRMSGAGPAEWGRVLILGEALSRHTDQATQATDVITRLDFVGGQIADQSWRIRRRIWADDPDDLNSPLHYDVTVEGAEDTETHHPASDEPLPPAAAKVLDALRAAEGPCQQHELVDIVVRLFGHGLRRETVSKALNDLERRGLAASIATGGQFSPKLWKAVEDDTEKRGAA